MNTDDIKIFGQHDENTLAQMRTAAEHEACVGAVLYGDAHLGYTARIVHTLAPMGVAMAEPEIRDPDKD